jgi:hypothetical protein
LIANEERNGRNEVDNFRNSGDFSETSSLERLIKKIRKYQASLILTTWLLAANVILSMAQDVRASGWRPLPETKAKPLVEGMSGFEYRLDISFTTADNQLVTSHVIFIAIDNFAVPDSPISFFVTPGELGEDGSHMLATTTSEFAREYPEVFIAINGSFFDLIEVRFPGTSWKLRDRLPSPREPVSLWGGTAISEGVQYVEDDPKYPTVCFRLGKVEIGKNGCPSDTLNALSGYNVLVEDGQNVAVEGDGSRHPRTLIGITEQGDVLLIVIDGRRRGHSVGATLAEAAEIGIRMGAYWLIELDGGRSSTLVIDGKVVNLVSPPRFWEWLRRDEQRSVGNHLGVRLMPRYDLVGTYLESDED